MSDLAGISCPSVSYCLAVGHLGGAVLVEKLTGATWSAVPAPVGRLARAELSAVSCAAVNRCMAVGSYYVDGVVRSLAESYDGRSLRTVSMPRFGAAGYSLSGVSCPLSNRCLAVGSQSSGSLTGTLFELFNGSSWSVMPGPAEMATTNNLSTIDDLAAVSCHTGIECTAVSAGGAVYSLRAARWFLTASPGPPSAVTALFGISCPAATRCVAVGKQSGEAGASPAQALLESLSGNTWTQQTAPRSQLTVADESLRGVSCSNGSHCTAVGSAENGTGVSTLVEGFNGARWSTLRVPGGSSQSNDLAAVSCASTNRCVAVGAAGTAEILRDGSWTRMIVPLPRSRS